MPDSRRSSGNRRRSRLLCLTGLLMTFMVGCSSVPDIPEGAFDPIVDLGAGAKQEAFEQQVANDPFPTAAAVGL